MYVAIRIKTKKAEPPEEENSLNMERRRPSPKAQATNEELNKHFENALTYLAEAFKLLEAGDPYDAAEKVWAAIKRATTALTLKFLGRGAPPHGTAWRSFVKTALLKAGLSETDASEWAGYFIDVRSKLHGDCFYGLTYEEEEHKPLMMRAKDYLNLVRKLVATES